MTTVTTKKNLFEQFPPKESQRYECLQSMVRKALQASRTHFDVDAAVTALYENVDQFGGKVTVCTIFDGFLNKIEEHVLAEMDKYCKEKKIEEQLLTLERVVSKLDLESRWNQYLDEQDRLSAEKAAEQAKIPEGYEMEDVMNFRMHQLLSKKQAELEEELAEINTEIAHLQEKNQTELELIQHQRKTFSDVAAAMERAVDATSTITKYA